MTAAVIGPGGGPIQVKNDSGDPLHVVGTEVDVSSPSGVALAVVEAEVRESLISIFSLLEDTLSVSDDATHAGIATLITAINDGVGVTGTVGVNNFPSDQLVHAATLPLPGGAAEQATLALVLARLSDIFGAVDGLEITAGNIDISNTTIGLSVDEVESILRQIRDNVISEDFATQATLEAVRVLLAGTLTIIGSVSVSNFPVSYPLPAGQVTTLTPQTNGITNAELRLTPVPVTGAVTASDFDIRNLASTQDSVQSVDAAELSVVKYVPIDFATAGPHTIVEVLPGQRLRLRRFLATGGDPDADPPANPILTITHGTESLRSTILIGRFSILGDDGQDLVITSSKAGQVDGTVGYTLE